MLAQNFKTAKSLGITDQELSALIKVLGMLERGDLRDLALRNFLTGGHHPTEIDANDGSRAVANAAFIVKAVNSHDALVKALEKILRANDDFVSAMPNEYEGDSLTDACDEARALLDTMLPTAEDVRGILAPVGGSGHE